MLKKILKNNLQFNKLIKEFIFMKQKLKSLEMF